MVLAEAVRRGTLTVLSQDELLEFERMLETAPEVYDYCANMTDEQLNHLIALYASTSITSRMSCSCTARTGDTR